MLRYEHISIRRTKRRAGIVLIAVTLPFALVGACNRQPEGDRSSPAAAQPESREAAGQVRVYVSDETGGNVVVVDPESGEVIDRLPVGKRPRGLRLSRDGAQLLVALSGSPIAGPGVDESTLPPPDRSADGVGIIDLASRKLVRTLDTGPDPEAFDISPDGRTLYVSNEDQAQMSVVDLASGTIKKRVEVGEEPEGVTVRPDGRVVYVTCEGDNSVVAVDTGTLEVISRIKAGPRPRAIAFTDDGATAFVSLENGAAVAVIDASKHTLSSIIAIPQTPGAPMVPRPMGVELSPDRRQLLVSLGRAKSVAIIDVPSRTFVRSIEDVGTRPWGIGVSPDGRTVYTANGPSGDVSVVDIAAGTIDRRIPVGGSPWGIVVATAPR
jgi:YVTN family beta-propeller protein